MPRIRYLKPEFFKDEDIAELTFAARLFYEGLWVLADKAGRLEDRPKRFKAEIFPYDNLDVTEFLDVLSKPKPASGKPFIHRYVTDGQRFIQILTWADHQRPHHTEADSKIPPAPPYGEGNGEGNGEPARSELVVKEPLSNGHVTVKPHKKTTPDPLIEEKRLFNEARKLYPGTKRGNETEFSTLQKKHKDWKNVLPHLLACVKYQIQERKERKERKEFVPEWPHFSTWINQRRFEEAMDDDSETQENQH